MCAGEYGSGSYAPGEHDVAFLTNFTDTPTVALQVVGFSAHLDTRHPYGGPEHHRPHHAGDVLGLDSYADYVNPGGFGVQVDDNAEGSAQVKAVYLSWSACLGLDRGLAPTSGGLRSSE